MEIQEKILLKDMSTFRIGGAARYFAVAKSVDDLREIFSFVKTRKLTVFVLGGGSNILVSDKGFPGFVIKNEIKGFKFINKDDNKVHLEIGAGEIWDEIVALSVSMNLSGLENLSGIPGTVGGATVQNAGAYGSELKDCFVSAMGLNSLNGKEFIFNRTDCQYSYRNSIFKKNKKFIITSVILELRKNSSLNIEYTALKNKLANKTDITPQKIREAVLEIREEKLPDWHKIGTAGSFFKNPIISLKKNEELKKEFPLIPSFPEEKGMVKVPLAWILDNICNLKGFKKGNAGLYDKQPIVLVNLGDATYSEIINLSEYVKKVVREKTGIDIYEEVEKIF
jgi:UDP-N-acetylmuramate dehydrogenase